MSAEKIFQENWFYSALLENIGETVLFGLEESHHLRKVLRIQMGTQVFVSNGKGKVFLCATEAKGESVEIHSLSLIVDQQVAPKLNLVLGLLKGRDLEEPVEGLCQLEVNSIQIVTSDHSQEFKGQDHSKLIERLRAKSLTGLKQAKKPWLTKIYEPVDLKKWREKNLGQDLNLGMDLVLVHPGEDNLPERFEKDFAVLIGPEGGFSEAELEWFDRSGGYRMGLGPTRLRGAHAPLVACGKLMGIKSPSAN